LIVNISEGIIEKFEFNEDKKTKDFVIERDMLTKPGSVYNEEMLKKDIVRIYATQFFDDIERTIEPSTDKEGEYIVKIKVKEASTDSISIGGGVDSALGVFGSVGVSDKNFLGRGQMLGLSGMIGSGILLSDTSIKNRVNYNVELNFKEPFFLNADNSLAAKMYLRGLGSYQIPLAVEKRYGINATLTHKIKKYDNLKASLGLGIEHIKLSEGDRNKMQSIYQMRNISFSNRSKQLTGGTFFNISPSVMYSNVDNEYMPREGMVAKASFVEALGLSKIKNTNGRLVGKITKYIPVFKKSTLSLTAKGGIKVHGSNMPEVMAFGLGGPYSIRGFRMNGVGTGDSYIMGSAELQTPIPFFDRFKYDVLKNMRFAVFADAGKVFDPTISAKLYDRPLSAISAGIGLRIYIPGVGPISIDYAVPFTHVGAYNHRGGYFTFGTSGLYDY
jgi:outer membrane protein insertion porin family